MLRERSRTGSASSRRSIQGKDDEQIYRQAHLTRPADAGASKCWPQDIGALAILDGTILLDSAGEPRIDAVREAITSRLHLVPRFRHVAVKKQVLFAMLAGGSAAASQRLARRYRLDRDAAYARLAAIDRTAVVTKFGEVEYAERGSGEPLLAVHGFFGGCDEALLSLGGLAADRWTIAPSRFGYLGSSMPADATVAGQADAFAALLDEVGITRLDVLAISSGATSAFQFALRHPVRVKRLAVISGNMPGGAAAVAPPQAARLIYRDLPMWALKVFARPVLLRLVGVPKGLPLASGDARIVSDLVDSFFPVALKTEGVAFDAFVSDPDVNNYPLETLTVPVLIVHAKDDPLVSYDAARHTAGRVPGARLASIERGGHLLLGDREDVRHAVTAFLADQDAP